MTLDAEHSWVCKPITEEEYWAPKGVEPFPPPLTPFREHLRPLVFRLVLVASGHKGDFLVAMTGSEDPITNAPLKALYLHVPNTKNIDQTVEALIAAVKTCAELGPGCNVYIGIQLMRPGLADWQKGKEADVVGVLAIVTDWDGKNNPATRHSKLPLPPHIEVETSPGNFQCWYFLDRPYSVAEAKPVMQQLARATGSDHTHSCDHVFRAPGTLNWPTKKKRDAGRDPTPFRARIHSDDDFGTISLAELTEAIAAKYPDSESSASGRTEFNWDEPLTEPYREMSTGELCTWIDRKLVKKGGDRSNTLCSAIGHLLGRGYTPNQVEDALLDTDHAVLKHYRTDDGLQRDIARTVAKGLTPGAQEKINANKEYPTGEPFDWHKALRGNQREVKPETIYKYLNEPGASVGAVIGKLVQRGYTPEQTVEALLPRRGLQIMQTAYPNEVEKELRVEVEAVFRKMAAANANTPASSNVFGREYFPGKEVPVQQELKLNANYLAYAVEASVQAMIAQRIGFFRRTGPLVRPTKAQIEIRGGGTVAGERLVPVSTAQLRHELSKIIQYQKFDARANVWKECHCPADLAQTILEWPDRWPLPFLSGITTAPTLRPDGSILDKPGYDEPTGILYQPTSKFPEIPARPTKDQAYAALAKLRHLVRTFPFVTDADRSVWLSAVLTGAIRRTLPAAPLHVFNAPAAGSGKGLLADTAAIIATGREASTIVQGDEAETEKRLVSVLMTGDPAILIDNVTRALLGDFLCSMLTRERVRPRKLGVHEAPEMLTNVLMLATGNNISTYGDMSRRAIRCTIDPQIENPDARKFENKPMVDAHRERAELLTAALTVLRAHVVAGSPCTGTLGSFDDWARIVVGALLWLDEADPITTQAELKAEDKDKVRLAALLQRWHAEFGDAELTAKEVMSREKTTDFYDAISEVAFDRREGKPTSTRLGTYLGHRKGVIVGGLKIRPGMTTGSGFGTWQVVK